MESLFRANESKLEQTTQAIAHAMEANITPAVSQIKQVISVERSTSPLPIGSERKDSITQTDYVPMTFRGPSLTQAMQVPLTILPQEQLSVAPTVSLEPVVARQPETLTKSPALKIDIPSSSELPIETPAPFPGPPVTMKQRRVREYFTMDSVKLQQLLKATTGNEKTAAAVSLATSAEWKSMVEQLKRAKQTVQPASVTIPIRRQQVQSFESDNEPLLPNDAEEAKKILRAVYRQIAALTRNNL
jgi:hypothetical protein